MTENNFSEVRVILRRKLGFYGRSSLFEKWSWRREGGYNSENSQLLLHHDLEYNVFLTHTLMLLLQQYGIVLRQLMLMQHLTYLKQR